MEITVTLVVKVTGGEIILQEDGSFHLAVDFTMGAEGREGSLDVMDDGRMKPYTFRHAP